MFLANKYIKVWFTFKDSGRKVFAVFFLPYGTEL